MTQIQKRIIDALKHLSSAGRFFTHDKISLKNYESKMLEGQLGKG